METFNSLYLVETKSTIKFFTSSKEAFEYARSLPKEEEYVTIEPIKYFIPQFKEECL